ncbi:hypothetical protein CVCC1112_549 [Paenarthrobacter nicotinovorans]|nr:hypothetical protein ANMWB30_30670 [Arthrobacter sp. MWB30]GAT85889.1 hypothetical protein CVCC1112_549 [Paenarthrobacter nicotinovorans]
MTPNSGWASLCRHTWTVGPELLHIERKGSSMNNSAAPLDRVPAVRGVLR